MERESTHFGSALDDAVLAARRRMRVGVDPDYDLVHEHFDALHYLLQVPRLVDDPDVDLVEHFLQHGQEKRLDPSPAFSMTDYLVRHPGRGEGRERNAFLAWLKHGRPAGEIAEPAPRLRRMAQVLGMEPERVAELVGERRADLQQRLRTGQLGAMFARAAQIEPLIGETVTEIARPKLLPLIRPVVVDEIHALYRAQEAAGFRRARVVLVADRAPRGGPRRMGEHLAEALGAHLDPDEIVVINTGARGSAAAGRYPPKVRAIDFAHLTSDLPPEASEHALVMLLRTFGAEAIVNAESRMLDRALRDYGSALAASERLFLVLFPHEQTALGTRRDGGLRQFYRTFEHVAGVITGGEDLARRLADMYRVPEHDRARIHALRVPVDGLLPVARESPAAPGRRPQVFWVGPRDHLSRVGLLWEIARLMPALDFRAWTEPATGDREAAAPPNVHMQGRWDHLGRLPLAEADVWLYPPGRSDEPSPLLDMVMTGIPVVCAGAGGGPGADEEGLWPVATGAGAEGYAAAIGAVLADPPDSRRRALSLRERMLRERTQAGFTARVVDLLLPRAAGEGGRP